MRVGRPERELALLRASCRRLRMELERPDDEFFVPVPHVSLWSPARHVDHVARVNDELHRKIRKLGCGLDEPGRGGLTALGTMMFALRWIPRGRGRAPESVVPQAAPSRADLERGLDGNDRALEELDNLTGMIEGVRGRSRHFVFGRMTARQWLAYANVHTSHHVKILDDIAAARR